MVLISRKLCKFLVMFSTGFTSLSVLLLFPLLITFFRFFRSTHLLMLLYFETLMSIIRTGLPILVELMDLVNSAIISPSQMTLVRWLTFLFRSQTVILIILLFWIYFLLLMLVFVLQWLSLHWEIMIMLLSQFPLTFQQFITGCPISLHSL